MTNKENKEKLTGYIALLSVPGIGRGRFHKLFKKFGSIDKIFSASLKELENIPDISHRLAHAILNQHDFNLASEKAARVIQLGWQVFYFDESDYPLLLKNIPQSDVPPCLFVEGDPENFGENAIAIVGSRHATEKGRRFAETLAAELAGNKITVVSGMAEGIDSYAHRGAIKAGGKTWAVWGNSLEIVYPPSNKSLAKEIVTSGATISEYLPETRPDKNHFPQRNRIISGLSQAVVVVEAGRKSGALLTASQALLQQRTLFAVPGHPTDKMSEGCNQLIQNGARLISSVNDIFDELPRLKGKVIAKKFVPPDDLTEIEKKIIDLFSKGPQQVDNLSRELNLSVSELMEFLLALELKGLIQEISGKRFELAEQHTK